jgi:hypothetical protein
MKHNTMRWLSMLALVLSLPACAGLMYSAEPMEAQVVDAKTQQSLENVIVVAHWQLERGTVGGSVPAGQLMVMETLTDKEGRFSFPGFGPQLAVTSHLVHKDPELLFFKSGYRYRVLTNEYSGDIELRTRLKRRSEWSGKTIELKPFKGTIEEYARHLEFFETSLDTLLEDECAWKHIPHMILAVSKQSAIFRAKGLYTLPSIESLDIRYKNFESKCGSVKEFFRNYNP